MLNRSTNATINLHCEVVAAAEIAHLQLGRGGTFGKLMVKIREFFSYMYLRWGEGGLSL